VRTGPHDDELGRAEAHTISKPRLPQVRPKLAEHHIARRELDHAGRVRDCLLAIGRWIESTGAASKVF
jgi:hypothetical protein